MLYNNFCTRQYQLKYPGENPEQDPKQDPNKILRAMAWQDPIRILTGSWQDPNQDPDLGPVRYWQDPDMSIPGSWNNLILIQTGS